MPPLSKSVRLFVAALSAAIVLSAVAMGVAALTLTDVPIWVLFGFELVIALCGVVGLLFASGRFQEGQGLALICIAGGIAVSAVLGYVGAVSSLGGGVPDYLKPTLFARLAAAGLYTGAASWAVLSRNPSSWSYAARAAVAGVPLLAVAVAAVVGRQSLGPALATLPSWAKTAGAGLGFVIAIVLVCACGHCLIRAFELGRAPDPDPAAPAAPATPAAA